MTLLPIESIAATTKMSVDASHAAGRGLLCVSASHFELQPPAVVYQTVLVDDKQNGSTPLDMSIRLSPAAASALHAAVRAGEALPTLIFGALRRCAECCCFCCVLPASSFLRASLHCSVDLRELEQYDAASGSMLGLRMSQAMFAFDLRSASGTLVVRMHRKELPVSTNFGDAPFVLTILLKPVGELVVSSPFHVASKEAPARAPRPPPKRQRPPSSKLPVVALASGEELIVSQMCKTLKRLRSVPAVAVASTASPRGGSVGAPDSPSSISLSKASSSSHFDMEDPFAVETPSELSELDVALARSLCDEFELPELDLDDFLFSA